MREDTKEHIRKLCKKSTYNYNFNKDLDIDLAYEAGFMRGIHMWYDIIWSDNKHLPKVHTSSYNDYVMVTDGTSLKFDNRLENVKDNEKWAYLTDLLPECPNIFENEYGKIDTERFE